MGPQETTIIVKCRLPYSLAQSFYIKSLGEGGPGPPERGKDKQSMPSKGRDNMEKDEEEQSNRT
jgi:hypothetical protein